MKLCLLTAFLLAIFTASLHALPSSKNGPAERSISNNQLKRDADAWLRNWEKEEVNAEDNRVVFDAYPQPTKDAKEQGGISPDDDDDDNDEDDIVIQFFNSPGEPEIQHEEELDWSERDFLKEEYEKGNIQDSWGEDRWNESPKDEEEEDEVDEEMWQQGTNKEGWNFGDESMDSEADEEVWSEDKDQQERVQETWAREEDEPLDNINLWEELEIQSNSDDTSKIIQEIYDIDEKMNIILKNLEELEESHSRASNLSTCQKQVCGLCNVKQKCVNRNKQSGECTSEQPDVKECCNIEYDLACKTKLEDNAAKIAKEIEALTKELEDFQGRLEKLSNGLIGLSKKPVEED